MGEIVYQSEIVKEKGFLYFLDKNGNIAKTAMTRPGVDRDTRIEVVKTVNLKKEVGYLYYIDKNGDIGRALLQRKGKSAKKRRRKS